MARIDAVLPLIGKLNYTWTNTESLLLYLIADLMGTSKEAAIIVFLTLNTTRARLDLIERLAKMATVPASTRVAVLDIAGRLKQQGKLRNKYNHCVYSFDENGELEATQLLRIAEFGDELKYGKKELLDDAEVNRIEEAIAGVMSVNRTILSFIGARGISI